MLNDGANKGLSAASNARAKLNTARLICVCCNADNKTISLNPPNNHFAMTETIPKCDPEGVYCVKRACAALDVCKKTLQKYLRLGLIVPTNDNPHRFLYSGQSIIDCWLKLREL